MIRIARRYPVALVLALGSGAGLALLPSEGVILALLGFALVGLVATTFAEPLFGLAVAIVLGPLQPLERAELGFALGSGQLVLGAVLFACAIRWVAQRRWALPLKSPVWAAGLAFLGVGFVSFFPARDLGNWATELVKWGQLLLVAALVASEPSATKPLCPQPRAPLPRGGGMEVGAEHRTGHLHVLLGAILLSGLLQAGLGIYQAEFRGFGPAEFRVFGTEARFRAYGSFEQPNPFGGYMGLIWPVALGVAVWRAQARAWAQALLAAGTAGASLYALWASGSRGALVGAAVATLAFALGTINRPVIWAGLALSIGAALYGFDLVNLPPSLEDQLQRYGSLDVRNAHVTPITFSTIERLAHWQAALRMIEASPWLGVGLGNYAAAYPEFRLLPWQNPLGHAHNFYLNIFAETGVLGLLSYLVFWALVIGLTWHAARRQPRDWVLLGVLAAWGHLSAHHVFDKLYVANTHILLGVYLGLVLARTQEARALHRVRQSAPRSADGTPQV
ncbi:MAG: O-antigen ligase family protein [Thermoflexales bacterium]|nr:O-antigen ligase family protein [Thermoflexales bacterium]